MGGFIKKDLLLIKGNLRVLLIVLFGFCIMLLNDMTSISFILPFMCVMTCISTFSYDEYNKWDAYALSLPNGRINIVKGKYIATIIVVVISTIITAVVTLLISGIKGIINYEEIMATLLGGIAGVAIVTSIMYPLLYKYGVEKGRNMIFIGIFGLGFIGWLLIKSLGNADLDIKGIINFINDYWVLVTILLSAISLAISYKVSERIYLKKEF